MYILAPNETAETYPYSIGQLRKDNPQTSFPRSPNNALLAEWNVYPVTPTSRPTTDHTQNVAEALPQQIDGVWTQVWRVTDASAGEIAERTNAQAANIRSERNERLAACDWTQLADAPVDSLGWANYRQALRDVTAQAGFPWSVSWPVPPV